MLNFQKVIVAGNLFQNPTIRRFDKSCVIELRIGCTESWINGQGERVSRTESFVAVRNNASFAFADWIESNFHKGTNVFVEGTNRTRSYRLPGADKDSYITEVMIDKIEKIADSQRQSARNGADHRPEPAQNGSDQPRQPARPAQSQPRQPAQNHRDQQRQSAPQPAQNSHDGSQNPPPMDEWFDPRSDNVDAFDGYNQNH